GSVAQARFRSPGQVLWRRPSFFVACDLFSRGLQLNLQLCPNSMQTALDGSHRYTESLGQLPVKIPAYIVHLEQLAILRRKFVEHLANMALFQKRLLLARMPGRQVGLSPR